MLISLHFLLILWQSKAFSSLVLSLQRNSIERFSIWHILFHYYCAHINCIVTCLWKKREGCNNIFFLSSLMQHLMQTKLNYEHSAWYVQYYSNASRYHKAAITLQMFILWHVGRWPRSQMLHKLICGCLWMFL